jgi:hypothetical protein
MRAVLTRVGSWADGQLAHSMSADFDGDDRAALERVRVRSRDCVQPLLPAGSASPPHADFSP